MSLLGELTYALITGPGRSIGTLIPDIVVAEAHRDELLITQHPVEGGGIISDHAFKRPAEVEMQIGYSDATGRYVGYSRDAYEALLAIQAARRPINVSTGKRRYRNMLVRGISTITDGHSANILMATVSLQEVIIVSTKTTGTGSDTTKAADSPSDQASPSTTGGVTDMGSQQGVTVTDTSFAGSFNPGNTNVGGEGGGVLSGGSFGLGGLGSGGDYLGGSGGQNGDIALDPIDVPPASSNPGVGFPVFGGT